MGFVEGTQTPIPGENTKKRKSLIFEYTFQHLLCVYACVPICVGMCLVVQAATEVRKRHPSPRAEVTGGCELPDMGAGKKNSSPPQEQ